MAKDDEVYRQHILEAIAKIEQYIKNISRAEFYRSSLIQDALVRELEIIGEASKRLSEEFKKERSGVPWKEIAGFRDKAIHHYLEVDLEVVWQTAQEDIKILKEALSR